MGGSSYEFEVPFQRRILAAAWESPSWFKANEALIQPHYFTDELLVGVAESLREAYRGAVSPGLMPDLPSILERVKENVAPGRKYSEYAKAVKKVWKVRGKNGDYYRQVARDFARKQAVVAAVGEAYQYIQQGEYDRIVQTIDRAIRVGSESQDHYYDFLATAADRAKRYAGERDQLSPGTVPTRLGPLDDHIRGGLGPGEVGCFMALPKHGKSTVLVHLGANALLAGRCVLHVSLENSQELVALRYDARLFGREISKIKKLPRKFTRHLQRLRESINGKLLITHAINKTLTLGGLEALIDGSSPRPELVVVDYPALLRTDRKRTEIREELSEIWEGLRRISGESRIPIWGAHQANRPGFGAKLLGLEHMAECFQIGAIIDVGISINKDPESPRSLELYVMANRKGRGDFSIGCEVNWDTCTLKPFTGGE